MAGNEFSGKKISPPKLKPIPSISNFKRDAHQKNPLLGFRLSKAKRQQVDEFLKLAFSSEYKNGFDYRRQAAKQTKIYTFRSVKDEGLQHELPRPPNYFYNILRSEAEAINPPELQKSWEDEIIKLLPQDLCSKFMKLVNKEIEEKRNVYESTLRELGISRIFKPLPGEKCQVYSEKSFLPGKTKFHTHFLNHRQTIKNTLFLTHPVMRSLLRVSYNILPENIWECSNYREMGALELGQLYGLVKGDLKKAEIFLSVHWYPKIIDTIFKKDKTVEGVSHDKLQRFLNCASHFLSIQIIELMRRTILHTIEIIGDENRTPMLSLELYYHKSGIGLSPTPEAVCAEYVKIINMIGTLAQELACLEYWCGLPQTKDFLNIKIPNSFMEFACVKLKLALEGLFNPIFSHTQSLEEEYYQLCNEEILEEVTALLAGEHTFTHCLEKVHYFENYVGKIKDMPLNIDFAMARVSQLDLIRNLRGFASAYIKDLEIEMVKMHSLENISICQIFEELSRQAVEIPKSSEQLMEMGKFMLYASTTLLDQLKLRIQSQVENLCHLLAMTFLSKEQLEENATTVSWIQRIKITFNENASLFEQYKSGFEEEIIARTDSVRKQLERLEPQLTILNYMEETDNINDYVMRLRDFLGIIRELTMDIQWINKEEKVFQFPLSSYPQLENVKIMVEPYATLVQTIYTWQLKYKVWMDGPFLKLTYEDVQSNVENLVQNVKASQRYYVKIIKASTADGESPFSGKVEGIYEELPAPLKLCQKTLDQLQDFKKYFIYIKILCNTALTQRQWNEMSEIVGFDITPNYGTTLRRMIGLDLFPYLNQFEGISIGASKEMELKKELDAMIDVWNEVRFETETFRLTDYVIVVNLTEILTLLEEHIYQSLTMNSSIYVKPFQAEMTAWYEKLLRVNNTILLWENVQGKLVYFLPIFTCKDFLKEIPHETSIWQKVDSMYKNLITAADREPLVIITADISSIYDALEHCSPILEDLHKAVNDFFDRKRNIFPRFYFLSNDEMVELIAESKDPLKMQPYLKKMFAGITKLSFDTKFFVNEFSSSEGEHVKLQNLIPTMPDITVENWLSEVEDKMRESVKIRIMECIKLNDGTTKESWIQASTGQSVRVVTRIIWTQSVLTNLRDPSHMRNLLADMKAKLNSTCALATGNMTNLQRINITALLVIELYAIEVTEFLVINKVVSDNDFNWLCQMRFYWENDVYVYCINAKIKYNYEYLGNTGHIVITPITERCFRTLISAFYINLNGAPEGSTATGKTETVKGLAKIMGMNYIVFNCSDRLDIFAMGKFFKGIAASGSWACLDDFNRMTVEVMSVLAQQINTIVRAIQSKAKTFTFDGIEIPLKDTAFICITMNLDYPSRSQLPQNLKLHFRTVAMLQLDNQHIAQVSLMSYGFKNALQLAQQLSTLYRLCSEQLAAEAHYHHGVRSLNTVLYTAHKLRQIKGIAYDEEKILVEAIYKEINPKFTSKDKIIFSGLLMDVFGSRATLNPDYQILYETIKQRCEEMNLVPMDGFIYKVIQVYDVMNHRPGLIIIGNAFCGKSSIIKVLKETLFHLKEVEGFDEHGVETTIVNPKSMSLSQLFGHSSQVSYKWTDGLITLTFREFAYSTSHLRKWVVFDGPIDSVWIENMNTILDDNRKFCLASGEVIPLGPKMTLVFEVMDVIHASPSTISRCGIIYIDANILTWRELTQIWISRQNPRWMADNEKLLEAIFEWLFPPCLKIACEGKRTQLIPLGELHLVKNTLLLIEMVLNNALDLNENNNNYVKFWIQASLMFAVPWGIGGALCPETRQFFDSFYKGVWKGLNEDYPIPKIIDKVEISIPTEGHLVDYLYTFRGKGSWAYWPEYVRTAEIGDYSNVPQSMVQTADSARYQYLMSLHIKYSQQMLIVGRTGTGKSMIIKNLLMHKLRLDEYVTAYLSFTAKITCNQAQSLIISKTTKEKKGVYGAPGEKTTIIFLDDFNRPLIEQYGAQPALELIRHYMDYGFWYDTKDLSKIYLKNVLFMAAQEPVGGSKMKISPRLIRHFNVVTIHCQSDEQICRIFSTILLTSFKKNGFTADIAGFVNCIVLASIHIYKLSYENLHPTPNKPFYLFTTRDVARLVYGCSLVRKPPENIKAFLARLWIHEALRVFYDRLCDNEDKAWMFENICNCIPEFFAEPIENVFSSLVQNYGKVDEDTVKYLMFGTLMDSSVDDENEILYEEIPSAEEFENVCQRAMEIYNSTHHSKLDIVLFRSELENLCHICRIIISPYANGLLIGMAGTSRKSLILLATAITGSSLYRPFITENYGVENWQNEIKKMLMECGGRNKNTTFLLCDSEMIDDQFQEDVNFLLTEGQVPNIYSNVEKQKIYDMVRSAAQGGKSSIEVSMIVAHQFFVNRCMKKLHIMLIFSPLGSQLRNQIWLYPSIVHCSTVLWLEPWPEEALEKVSKHYMKAVDLSESLKSQILVAFKHFHVSARQQEDNFFAATGLVTYVTSTTFLGLINTFIHIIKTKSEDINTTMQHYLFGIRKLLDAAEEVERLHQGLLNLRAQIVHAKTVAKNTAAGINQTSKEIEKQTQLVEIEQTIEQNQAAKVKSTKEIVDTEMSKALPTLNECVSALGALKSGDYTNLKSLKKAPEPILLVMTALCILKEILPDKVTDKATGKRSLDYWPPSKRMLGDFRFLTSIKEYEKDSIPPQIMRKIRNEYLSNPLFVPAIVSKLSKAAGVLCRWIIALEQYDTIFKIVAPTKAILNEAQEQHSIIKKSLAEKQEHLVFLENHMEGLQNLLEDTNNTIEILETKEVAATDQYLRAQKLIQSLDSEKLRWMKIAESLQKSLNTLPGDVLVSSGIITYLAPFTLVFRSQCIEEWHALVMSLNIPTSTTFEFTTALGSELRARAWHIAGLPCDRFSLENAVIVENSLKWSLIIDPQCQANKWIKNMEKKNGLEVYKAYEQNYLSSLESCIMLGRPALLESVGETLDMLLNPVLYKRTFTEGTTMKILLTREQEYNPKFRFYLTSKLRNPHYLPDIYSKVSVVNFNFTIEGLQEQLLSIVVKCERPDLEDTRQTLAVQSAAYQNTLEQIEANIFETLSESTGCILDDDYAIQVLNSSKDLAQEIQIKEATVKETNDTIDEFRQNYRTFSQHSAVLYYTITDLPNLNYMYQYSLDWFLNLYTTSCTKNLGSMSIEERLQLLTESFTLSLYQQVSRSLFDKDKLLYSFILCCQIMIAVGELQREELMFFISHGPNSDILEENPALDWLSDQAWNVINHIGMLPSFSGFKESFLENLEAWNEYTNFPENKISIVPEPWDDKLSSFSKLLIIQNLHPDKILRAVASFVSEKMGVKYVTPPPFSIDKAYDDSDVKSPLLFISSPGTDPAIDLAIFAQHKEYESKFHVISLGQGQGPIAQNLIRSSQGDGSWVCLQNCHLALSWMPSLERIWETIDNNNSSPGFRLWLTTLSSDKFPAGILQNCIKLTHEPPIGLKQNLRNSYQSEVIKHQQIFEGCRGGFKEFSKLLYALCFFHAIVQERKMFGPIGWNIPYMFSDTDLVISIKFLQVFINEYKVIPFDAIKYVIGECIYGGHITDQWDRRLLNTLLASYIKEDIITGSSYLFAKGSEYCLPADITYEACLEQIEALPQTSVPQVFGLHANAGIVRNIRDGIAFKDSLYIILGPASTESPEVSENILLETISLILKKIASFEFNISQATERYPLIYEEAMNIVLLKEMEHFNQLLVCISKSLGVLKKAILGQGDIMSPNLEQLAFEILNGQVPQSWKKQSYPTIKPLGNYVDDLVARLTFINEWYENGLPVRFWLPGLFKIKHFITNVLLKYSRKQKLIYSILKLDFEVIGEEMKVETHPKFGIYIYGLYLDGARWDRERKTLAEQFPNILWDTMPLIWLRPVTVYELDEAGRYNCPVYITPVRQGIRYNPDYSVLAVLIPSVDMPLTHWIKRGTALLCQLEK